MNVTVKNASNIYPDFVTDLRNAVFYAVDLEMSGVDVPEERVDLDCTPEEVYRIKRDSAMRYTGFQFGVTFFLPSSFPTATRSVNSSSSPFCQTISTLRGYDAKSYNFFLVKKTGDITLSASGIDFLSHHGMNFQTWLCDGMPFFTEKEEEELRSTKTTDFEARLHPSSIPQSSMPRGIHNWVASMDINLQKHVLPSLVAMARNGQHNILQLSVEEAGTAELPSISFSISDSRRVNAMVTNIIRGFYTNHPFLSVRVERLDEEGNVLPFYKWGGACMGVTVTPKRECWKSILRYSQDQQLDAATIFSMIEKECREEQLEQEIKTALGFRIFWKAMIEAKIPLVGHNCLHDLMFVLQMHEAALPETLAAFKTLVLKTFPAGVWDTKSLATKAFQRESVMPRTHLERVYNYFITPPPSLTHSDKKECGGEEGAEEAELFQPVINCAWDPDNGRNKDGQTEVSPDTQHNGAYDAYLTGYSLASFAATKPALIDACRNVLCGHGSTYFICIDEEKDQLLYPYRILCVLPQRSHYLLVKEELISARKRHNANGEGGQKKGNDRWIFTCSMHENSSSFSKVFMTLVQTEDDFAILRRSLSAEKFFRGATLLFSSPNCDPLVITREKVNRLTENERARQGEI